MGIEMRKYGRERGQGDQTMPPGELDGDAMPFAPKQLSKQEFGRRVYQLMIAKGWRQSDLARQSGIPKDSISTYIRGKVLPTPVSVSKLAEALGVSPEKLMPDHIESPANVENPELEIRANPGMNGTAWLRVNMLVSMKTAAQIMDLLENENVAHAGRSGAAAPMLADDGKETSE